jgi:O-methyltransferase
MSLVKKLYRSLPQSLQRMMRPLTSVPDFIPFTQNYRRRKWLAKVYTKFSRMQREYIFLSMARYLNINRPVEGYYFEFGCNGANTLRMAWDAFHHLFDLTYVGFDSFQGLPEISEIDRQTIWAKGKLAFEESEYLRIGTRHGIPRQKIMTVPGYYNQSLTEELKNRLLPVKAAVVYIDCDLYASTVPVLDWVTDFLQRGTIVVLDDWNCFHGDPDRGERLAWREYCEKNSGLRFEPFVATNEAQSFIFLGSR